MARAKAPEPNLSVSAFAQRCKSLAVQFGGAIGLPTGELTFAPEISNTAALMTLVGRGSEMIARNRGPTHRVIPLTAVTDDVLMWVGYREIWQKQDAEQNFRFVEGGVTLHVGRPGELTKPQLLRSEWVGRRSRAFVDLAGHPHWQMDVLESVRASAPVSSARFDDPAVRGAIEFDSAPASLAQLSLLSRLTIEKMHLASAALWWKTSSTSVAHQPDSVAEVDRWVLGCVAYLRQEARRCTMVSHSGAA